MSVGPLAAGSGPPTAISQTPTATVSHQPPVANRRPAEPGAAVEPTKNVMVVIYGQSLA